MCRWPGSTHDQMIFNFSSLKAKLEANEFGNSILLGDAGYACKSYLITPLTRPTTPSEKSFQAAFIKTRSTVERTIGVWKKRFPSIGHSEKTINFNLIIQILCFRNSTVC